MHFSPHGIFTSFQLDRKISLDRSDYQSLVQYFLLFTFYILQLFKFSFHYTNSMILLHLHRLRLILIYRLQISFNVTS